MKGSVLIYFENCKHLKGRLFFETLRLTKINSANRSVYKYKLEQIGKRRNSNTKKMKTKENIDLNCFCVSIFFVASPVLCLQVCLDFFCILSVEILSFSIKEALAKAKTKQNKTPKICD
jgi:hypothetical protein